MPDADMESRLTRVENDLHRITTHLESLADRQERGQEPVRLEKLQGDDAGRALTQLSDWVQWLVTEYHLDSTTNGVPSCWYRHSPWRQELWALFIAWNGAWSLDASRFDPLAWHRDFAAARQRWQSEKPYKTMCSPGRHIEDEHRADWHDAEDFGNFARKWVAQRSGEG